jgi:hypothetical protein
VMISRRSILMSYLIVMCVADNGLGLNGGEHFSRALMQLTGLTMLDLEGMCLLCCWDRGVACNAREEEKVFEF